MNLRFHDKIVIAAVIKYGSIWPQPTLNDMIFLGERITRDEFKLMIIKLQTEHPDVFT